MAKKKPAKAAAKTEKKAAPKRAKKPAKPKVSARRTKLVAGDEQYPLYDSSAKRGSYKVGDIVKFPKVRDWLSEGQLVEAYGKIVGVGIFDKDVPYIEVSFHDAKKLNKVDLGNDVRRFILEQK